MNEAGKSNILLALWRLNPAQSGEIVARADLPRHLFAEARNKLKDYTFIEADFQLNAEDTARIAEKALIKNKDSLKVRVSRRFDRSYSIQFLDAQPAESFTWGLIRNVLLQQLQAVQEGHAGTPELQDAKEKVTTVLTHATEALPEGQSITEPLTKDLTARLLSVWSALPDSPFRKHVLTAWNQVRDAHLHFENPAKVNGVQDIVLKAIPKFVYYSNYGNLDSEIFLPHAIENMRRTDLTGTAEARARTLRVLFEFVGLNPQEIMEMGQELPTHQATEQNVHAIAERKADRQALLHSAMARLSREFKAWWKQGEYDFDFRADGNFFRIYVSDKLRRDPIELENRSTGLQWFLSFYLVFLVESGDAHRDAILLLDEAGHSLHPLAQRDLAAFFANLSQTNQVIHTTQSPFLVDTNHVERVKVVYVDDEGYTVTSENLRANEGTGTQQRSVYAVHAALGLSISDTLLQGCLPVIVEGVSDQIYLNAIKNYLVSTKSISPSREILFVPSGGTKGIKPLTGLLVGREGDLPSVVMDADQAGRNMHTQLKADLYKSSPKRLIPVSDFISVPDGEIEDLIPFEILAPFLDRMLRDAPDLFADTHNPAVPLVNQVEAFAAAHGITLDPGWKVTLAKGFKGRLLHKTPPAIDKTTVALWKKMFSRMLA